MSGRQPSNASVLARAVRTWRREGRLDEVSEVWVMLAATSAALADAACGVDSDVVAYARARCVQVHAQVLDQLSSRIRPVAAADDPWDAIARELDPSTGPEKASWAAVEFHPQERP